MYKIENILKASENEYVKYTHFFDKNFYVHSEKESTDKGEIGLKVCVSKVPRTVDKWSYLSTDCIGEIIEIFYFYETKESLPQKKYLVKFQQGNMFCDVYKEVVDE